MLTFHLVKATGQMEERSYDATKFARYTRKIESGYLDTNPYHNRQACVLRISAHQYSFCPALVQFGHY